MFLLSSLPHSNAYSFNKSMFNPQTPSPLRTTYNANRSSMNQTHSSPLSNVAYNDENAGSSVEKRHQSLHRTPDTTPTSITTGSTRATTTSSKPFTFEQRARSLSPRTQLARHEADSREKSRNKLYNRIRGRRECARDDRLGEQVLRMDYIQARRFWEEEMARRASQEVDPADDVDMDEEAEMSPTEEREIEELVSLLESKPEPQPEDEDEYDDAFREILQQDTTMDMS